MIKVEHINESNIVYRVVSDPYYNYCINLLKYKLMCDKYRVNLVLYYFDFTNYRFNNDNKTIELCIQYEHTLVKNGGRSLNPNTLLGDVKTNDGENYLIRIDRYEYLNNLNYIIEYSLPNIFNISKNDYFKEYSKKNIYISPLIPLNLNKSEIKKNTITLFGSNYSQRRNDFYGLINNKKIKCENKTGYYTESDIISLYESSQILVNIHQTDHHHTFEELRVLSALCRGVIVISENVPLKDVIPYNEHIIWSDYDKITDKIIEVQNNYDFYFNKIFNKNLIEILNDMEFNNKKTINNIQL